LEEVASSLEASVPDVLATRTLEDQDWVKITQAQFTPIDVGRLIIAPSWHAVPDKPGLIPIRIDPGSAFGTGTHPTTRLCLEWLSEHISGQVSVLDFGCGSGILSIAAAKLGAASVTGVDIDPIAVATAAENARGNQVVPTYLSVDAFAAGPADTFDVVVANILAKPLMLLAPSLLARLNPRGSMILSGILDRQADDVIGCYQALNPRLHWFVWKADDGWVAVCGKPQD
jgi:ribosomal protein L11 methyltransferase